MTDQAKRAEELYEKLSKLPDRSALLSVHAALGYEDGQAYTEAEYKNAIRHLEEAIEQLGDSEDHILARAVQWCLVRSHSGADLSPREAAV